MSMQTPQRVSGCSSAAVCLLFTHASRSYSTPQSAVESMQCFCKDICLYNIQDSFLNVNLMLYRRRLLKYTLKINS